MLAAKALLFDMDGLMVDSEPLWFQVERDFAGARGGEFTEAMARQCVGRGMAHTLGVMREALGLAVDVDRDVADIVDRFVAKVNELTLKSGFIELFDDAARLGVPQALASSSARKIVHATLDRFGIRQRFDAVVSGDCVPRPKPAPDIFLEAARRLAVPAADCVVLEDSASGCAAARAAGMRVVAVPETDPSAFAPLADVVVADLVAARQLLRLG